MEIFNTFSLDTCTVEVDARETRLPEVRELLVMESPYPVVNELATMESPDEVPVPVVTPEVICTEPVEAGAIVMLPEVEVFKAKLALAELRVSPLAVNDDAPAAVLPRVNAPVDVPVFIDVVKFEVALRLTAAPVTVSPALPVSRLENVFAPANVCVPVVTIPPNEALAASKLSAWPVRVMPLALGDEPIAAKVRSPEFVPVRLSMVLTLAAVSAVTLAVPPVLLPNMVMVAI